ncbi:hypothetical protein Enr10x_22240 [Gimesia panareensis]|uniref:Uncharacterized protein n=1 Tax=Gimesia panareensis TaxID=2527978 RepID=A0A517Q5M1_9PLAN|nr:hypothetical protein [Gimesia panareensis]QDT26912.1 hypothetical protein Enr10x_22240 [Gimesia panareensis]
MASIADRLPLLVELRSENREIVRANAADPEKDRNGRCSSMLAIDLRFFAVADFILQHDITSFKTLLSEAARIRTDMFSRFENGEFISDSYLTMIGYKSLFNALAAGDMSGAEQLAAHLGGRDDLERKYDHPFDYTLGYTLRAFVLQDRDQMQEWTPKFVNQCYKSKMKDFLGYGAVFQALLTGDTSGVNAGLASIVQGHQKQSKGRGVFVSTEDELLCIWGLGMANLVRAFGIPSEAIPPLIPRELLTPVNRRC